METPILNLWSPDPGDDYALTQDLAAMADDIEEAIVDVRDSSLYLPVANQVARDSIESPQKGLRVFREDTNREERWSGSRWVLQPGIETRRFQTGRYAVPAGSTDYYFTVENEVTSYRTDGYFATTHTTTGPDAGFNTLDPGFYWLSATVVVEGAFTGPQARLYFSESTAPGTPFAQVNFGGGQFATLNAPWFTDGTKKFGLWGHHNSGGARNMYGHLDIVRLRGF